MTEPAAYDPYKYALIELDGEASERPFTTRMSISLAGSLEFAKQNQDQHDNEDEAEPAAAIVTGPIKGTATEAAKAPEECNN